MNHNFPPCSLPDSGRADGTNCCEASGREPEHRPYQSWSYRQDVSIEQGSCGAGSNWHRQCAAAQSAIACDGLLRDCDGALYAFFLSRGAAVLVGGGAMAS